MVPRMAHHYQVPVHLPASSSRLSGCESSCSFSPSCWLPVSLRGGYHCCPENMLQCCHPVSAPADIIDRDESMKKNSNRKTCYNFSCFRSNVASAFETLLMLILGLHVFFFFLFLGFHAGHLDQRAPMLTCKLESMAILCWNLSQTLGWYIWCPAAKNPEQNTVQTRIPDLHSRYYYFILRKDIKCTPA